MRKILALFIGVVIIPMSYAQESKTQLPGFVSLNINSDAFTGLEFGYNHSSRFVDKDVFFYAKLNIPLILSAKQKRIDTWEIQLGVLSDIITYNRFLLLADFNVFTIRHKQSLGTFVPLGFNLQLTPSVKTKKGYWGFQMNYNHTVATYIKHSNIVKERFQELTDVNGHPLQLEPQNGFYSFTGNSLNFGIETKLKISKGMDMYFDIGVTKFLSNYTKMSDAMMFGQVPFYMDLQVNYLLRK